LNITPYWPVTYHIRLFGGVRWTTDFFLLKPQSFRTTPKNWKGSFAPEEVRHDRRQLINNALVFAASWGQKEAAGELLTRGAEINAIPAGFDFAGTPLHYAALNNRREMADWLGGGLSHRRALPSGPQGPDAVSWRCRK
jgi:hypothetical protein